MRKTQKGIWMGKIVKKTFFMFAFLHFIWRCVLQYLEIIHICFVTMTIYSLELVVNKTREKKTALKIPCRMIEKEFLKLPDNAALSIFAVPYWSVSL